MLPPIYKTQIPGRLREALQTCKTNENSVIKAHSIITIEAPTGHGKTFMTNHIMAELCAKNVGEPIECVALMPFRVSVKSMHRYLSRTFKEYVFGYAMKDDRNVPKGAHCTLKTVGYWLEEFFRVKDLSNKTDRKIVLLDEAHDTSWQTDLAIKVLSWLVDNGHNITIIIASATLSKFEISGALHLSVTEEANVEVHYLPRNISGLKQGNLTAELRNAMFTTLSNVVVQPENKILSETGNILIILPGMDDITLFHERLYKDTKYASFLICPLHSQLSKEEIDMAIKPNMQRKIILATNIVENAITIKNLEVVIDCGYRKILYVDSNGVQQLIIEEASRDNLTQSCGRVGREGKRGHAFLMMTEETLKSRKKHSSEEVERNPYYQQIIKLISKSLPVYEILNDKLKVAGNIKFLVNCGILEVNDELIKKDTNKNIDHRYRVTPIGMVVSRLPLSIRAGRFLAIVLETLSPLYHYVGCVIACWIDCNSSIWYRNAKSPKESQEEYDAKTKMLKAKQARFLQPDCLMTFLNVWAISWIENPASFKDWCIENGLYERTLHEINSSIKNCLTAIDQLQGNLKIHKTKITEWTMIASDLKTYCSNYYAAMKIAFKDWSFVQTDNTSDYYRSITGFSNARFVIDKAIHKHVSAGLIRTKGPNIIVTKIKKINDGFMILSNIIDIETQEERAKRISAIIASAITRFTSAKGELKKEDNAYRDSDPDIKSINAYIECTDSYSRGYCRRYVYSDSDSDGYGYSDDESDDSGDD